MHDRRKFLLWFLIAIAVLLLIGGIAYAQDPTFDPVAWGSSPALALIALTGAVAWVRQTKWGSGIDGPVRVGILTAVLGAALGVLVQALGTLVVDPFAAYPSPLGGLAYGLALAFTAITGVAIFNYIGSKVRPLNLSVSTGPEPAMLGVTATSTAPEGIASTVLEYIIQLVKDAVGAAKLPAALVAVAPVLAQFAQSEVVLTDDVRSEIQGKVLSLLRKAGLVGVDL